MICDLSDPVEDGPSRMFFTKEYFARVQRLLEPNGVFVVQAGSVAPVDMQLHVRLINTLRSVFEHVASYTSFVPAFVTPWGFALARSEPIKLRPDVAAVDRLLAASLVDGGRDLVMFDGTTLLGMLQLPRHLRQAIGAGC